MSFDESHEQVHNDRSSFRAEVLKGMRALSHLRNLQSRRPDVFAKSEVRLRARGWVPTETVVVFRSLRDTIATTSAVTTLETTITSDEGEVTFWSWNDGDNGTWEGEMFASRYEDSAEVGTAGQIDIRTAAPVVLWEEVFYEKPGTGEDFQEPLSASPISRNSGSTSIGSIQPNKMNTTDFFWDWVDCVVATCLTAIVGCASVGPGYIECVVLFCHAGVIGCAVAKIIRYIARG